jgi:hypothetical protein
MRILIPSWSGAPARGFYRHFQQGLTRALCECGHEPLSSPFAQIGQFSAEEANALYTLLTHNRPAAVIDLACWGHAFSQIAVNTGGGVRPIFDTFEMPYLGLLLDQPFNQPLNRVVAERLYAAYPDLGHPPLVPLVFPNLRVSGDTIAPTAIQTEDERSAAGEFSQRTIDVLYIGNLDPGALERFWHALPGRSPAVGLNPVFCDRLADTVLAAPDCSLHSSTLDVLRDFGERPAGFSVGRHLQAVELHVRHVFRRDALLAVARTGVRMMVVGKGWSSLDLPTTVQLRDYIDYEGIFGLAARARIALDASTYMDGANDRVFGYALNRAVCFTNATGYLRSRMVPEGGLQFYSMRRLPELGERIVTLLGQPQTLQDAAERARAAVLCAHTWRHRIEPLLDRLRH